MTKSKLILAIHKKQSIPRYQDTHAAVKLIFDLIAQSLADNQRIEIRGFGSFSLHYHPRRLGRNPKSGAAVPLMDRYLPYFRPGKGLRKRVNKSAPT